MSPCGEVIQSSLCRWRAVSAELNMPPAFGSIVFIAHEGAQLVGVVANSKTEPTDSLHVPVALGYSEEQLAREYPQASLFLQTTFECCVIGHVQGNVAHHQLPSRPPRIHALVYQADAELYHTVFNQETYLSLLFNYAPPEIHIDDLLFALLVQRLEKKELSRESIHAFAEAFSLSIGSDYRRLKNFLQRLERSLELIDQ